MAADDHLEILCPCCSSTLVVDRSTGEIIWHKARETRAAGRSLDEMVRSLEKQKDETSRRLERELESQKDRNRLLDAKFREALSRAEKSDKKPLNPLDLD